MVNEKDMDIMHDLSLIMDDKFRRLYEEYIRHYMEQKGRDYITRSEAVMMSEFFPSKLSQAFQYVKHFKRRTEKCHFLKV